MACGSVVGIHECPGVSRQFQCHAARIWSWGRKERRSHARQLLEQAPQTEYALNALKIELGPRRDRLVSMQHDLSAHLEQFKHSTEKLTDADRAVAREALNAETQTVERAAREFQMREKYRMMS
jgi:predicted  nucleic acid-binding Zn-ribbon protein